MSVGSDVSHEANFTHFSVDAERNSPLVAVSHGPNQAMISRVVDFHLTDSFALFGPAEDGENLRLVRKSQIQSVDLSRRRRASFRHISTEDA